VGQVYPSVVKQQRRECGAHSRCVPVSLGAGCFGMGSAEIFA
jgi:hypothetical protein